MIEDYTLTVITILLNLHKYGECLLNSFINVFIKLETLSAQELLDYNLYYKDIDNKELVNKLSEFLLNISKGYRTTVKPVYPQEEITKVKEYCNSKLKKCKEGGEAYNETLEIIKNIESSNIRLIKFSDMNLYSNLYHIRNYWNNLDDYNKNCIYNTEIAEAKELGNKTINEVLLEKKFLKE